MDGLGHTRLLLDNTGTVTDTYLYDAWGNGTQGITPNPFTWNGAFGYQFIPFTGFYYVGAREYDPRTARWLQRDPIGVAGGHPNVYLYCANDPVNKVDPTGLDTHVYEFASQILVVTTIQFHGPNANASNCARVERSMLKAWNQGFTYEGKPVIFAIRSKIGGKAEPFADQVYMVSGAGRSYVCPEPVYKAAASALRPYLRLRPNQEHTCYLYSGDPNYDWMVAHEFGHLLGLRDRYDKQSIPHTGWETNIMGKRLMPVQQRNIDEFCQRATKSGAWHTFEK